jgi:hypothetical protein
MNRPINNGVINSIQTMIASGMNMTTNMFVLGDDLIAGSGGNCVNALNNVSQVADIASGSYVRVRTAQLDLKERQQLHLNTIGEMALADELATLLAAKQAKTTPKPKAKAKAK